MSRRLLPEKPRVLLGLMDFVGYLSAISNGLTAHAIESFVLHLGEDRWSHYSARRSNALVDFLLFARRKFRTTRGYSKFNPLRYVWTLAVSAATFATILWIAARFDVVYLKGGESLTESQWDLRLFRAVGIVTMAHFAGSDSRPPYLNGFHGKAHTAAELVFWSRKIREAVNRTRDLFDYVIDNPLTGQYHSRRCVIGQCLGTVADFDWVERCGKDAPPRQDNKVRIVHAPSRAEVKGTREIRAAVAKLRECGYAIDYVEVENKTNAEAIAEIAGADIVVDELYSDTVGATVSSEAAILAKPSVNGTYGVSDIREMLPTEAILPTHLIAAEEIFEALEFLVRDAEYRCDLGRRARAFVAERNTPEAMAARFMRIARGEAPASWYFEPSQVKYVAGVAGNKDDVRHAIQLVLHAGGLSALCLDDRPVLRDAIVRFAGETAAENPKRLESVQ